MTTIADEMTPKRALYAAEIAVDAIVYDRDRWRLHWSLSRHPLCAITLTVTTKKPHEPTGLYSTGNGELPWVAFESAESLLSEMQSLVEEVIAEIEALPPPTMELAERLRS